MRKVKMIKHTYTGIFFEDGTHMTWHFDLENILFFPDGVEEGDFAIVKVVGKYEDEEVACFIVEWEEKSKTDIGIYLHITTKAKIEPYYSGIRATENGWKYLDRPYYLKGIWRYG